MNDVIATVPFAGDRPRGLMEFGKLYRDTCNETYVAEWLPCQRIPTVIYAVNVSPCLPKETCYLLNMWQGSFGWITEYSREGRRFKTKPKEMEG